MSKTHKALCLAFALPLLHSPLLMAKGDDKVRQLSRDLILLTFDTDNSGTLNSTEITAAASSGFNLASLDRNKDGLLDGKELKRLSNNHGKPSAKLVLLVFDMDGDGSLNALELTAAQAEGFNLLRLDKNADGIVTQKELSKRSSDDDNKADDHGGKGNDDGKADDHGGKGNDDDKGDDHGEHGKGHD